MKRLKLILFAHILICAPTAVYPQVQEMSTLCKVWGFLKYYQPTVQKGKVDWDAELKVALKDCEEGITVDSIVEKWFCSLGGIDKLKQQTKPQIKNPEFNRIDYSWIGNSKHLSPQNKKSLNHIIENYKPRNNVYIRKETKKHEKYRDRTDLSKTGRKPLNKYEKLNNFFMYWNAINYFYPYIKANKLNWDSILIEYIPKIRESPNDSLYYMEFAKAHTNIMDSHGYFADPYTKDMWGTKHFYPIRFTKIDGTTYISWVFSGYKEKYGLTEGSKVTKINHCHINDFRDSLEVFYLGSRQQIIDNITDNRLKFLNSDTLHMEFIDTLGKKRNIAIELMSRDAAIAAFREIKETEEYKNYTTYRLVENKYGYINNYFCTKKDLLRAFREFRHLPAIIIDTRRYGGVEYKILGSFLSNRRATFCKYYENNYKFPGTMKRVKEAEKTYLIGLGLQQFIRNYKGKIIVLIDESNVSATEFALFRLKALKEDAVYIGRNTMGAIGGMYTILLKNSFYCFTRDIVLSPDGICYQNIGYPPDIYVPNNLDLLIQGKDDIFEKALEYLNQKKHEPKRDSYH